MSLNMTSAGAAVADIVPKERLAEGIGIYGISMTIGQALGPLIALSIVANGELSNFNTLFYVSAAFCGFSLLNGCFIRFERDASRRAAPQNSKRDSRDPELRYGEQLLIPEVTPTIVSPIPGRGKREWEGIDASSETKHGESSEEGEDKAFFGFDRNVLSPAIVLVLYFFGISGVLIYLTLFGRTRGFPVDHIGWFFFASAAGIIIARLLFGKIVDKRGPDIIVIPGILIVAFCLFSIPLMPSLPVLIFLGLPYGIANGAVSPNIQATMFKRCSPKRRGTVSAAFAMAVDIGFTVGAPVLGWVADLAGFIWVYRLSAASVVAALLVFIFLVSDKRYIRRNQC